MNRNTTIALVVVFAALLLYVLLIQRPAEEAQANATPTPLAASVSQSGNVWAEVTADQILNVQITDRAKTASVAFGRADAQTAWAVSEPQAQPADQLSAAQNAASVALLSYTNIVTTATDLTPFGVLSPTYTIELKLVGGRVKKLLIGDKTLVNSSYYATLEGEPTVLVIGTFEVDELVKLVENPPYLTPTATPDPNLTPSLTPTP